MEVQVAAFFRSLVILAVVLMASAMARRSESLSEDRIYGHGIIFSEATAKRSPEVKYLAPKAESFWAPTTKDIDTLEGGLTSYLATTHNRSTSTIIGSLDSYKRQYIGYMLNGEKWIFLGGFCKGFWSRKERWKDAILFVMDGGSCFFHLHYNLTKGQFEGFKVNGEA